ncbi:MAG TPA: sigma-70 family RNA polymerase sigma factor [Terriglobia bacterium]|nr:sigma-70 family RNA polymerase sigma factor [Terriglobia bacterium]
MRLEDQASDADLLLGVTEGDEQAFVTLYRRWQGPLFRFALQMTGNPGFAEEIVQETFMTLARAANSFDPARGAPRSFLYGVCRNHVLRHTAGENLYVGLPDPATEGGNGHAEPAVSSEVLADLATAETVRRVRRAVLSLPPTYRETVVLCDLHEMTYEQAAAALGCPKGTVRSRLHRARELLLDKLRRAGAHPLELASTSPRESEGSR